LRLHVFASLSVFQTSLKAKRLAKISPRPADARRLIGALTKFLLVPRGVRYAIHDMALEGLQSVLPNMVKAVSREHSWGMKRLF
jgi:hypothetical protein